MSYSRDYLKYLKLNKDEFIKKTEYFTTIVTEKFLNCELDDIELEMEYSLGDKEEKIKVELKLKKEENLFTIIDFIKHLASM